MGFHADTMHMARLWDTARDKISGGKGYKLEALTSELLDDQRFAKVNS
jgi:DNA polymerase-1